MDYKDVNVETYLEIMATIKEHEGEEIDLHVRLIAILFGMSEDEVLDMPLDKFQECETEIGFLYRRPKITGKIPNVITLNNRKYNVIKDSKKLTASQYIDYQAYIGMEDPDSHIAEVLSVFLVPEGEKYGHYDIEPVIEEIKRYMPIQTALDVCFFFRKKSLKSSKRTLRYLLWMMRGMRMKNRKNKQMVEKITEIEKNLMIMQTVLQESGADSIS